MVDIIRERIDREEAEIRLAEARAAADAANNPRGRRPDVGGNDNAAEEEEEDEEEEEEEQNGER